jgi:hypothetical protein
MCLKKLLFRHLTFGESSLAWLVPAGQTKGPGMPISLSFGIPVKTSIRIVEISPHLIHFRTLKIFLVKSSLFLYNFSQVYINSFDGYLSVLNLLYKVMLILYQNSFRKVNI